jgi:crotonobetainyl-CoA:carnitine CoA-transferase CaiB-like acyl-CoA transferase
MADTEGLKMYRISRALMRSFASVRVSEWPQATELQAPLLGEHNDPVLRDLLGLDEQAIAALYEEKVLVRDPLLG